MVLTECVEIIHGEKRAVFHRTDDGWKPDWFYEAEQPMLRFKDHEWLSIGHVHPTVASRMEMLPNGGRVFHGESLYGQAPVQWSVTVQPDADGDGFIVECAFTPQESIELLEAYTTFETPYDYDGSETSTSVIGMNPVVRWSGNTRETPPIWENPAWVYSRPQIARITAPCSTPLLCQAITEAHGVPDRYLTIIGDWQVCRVQDVYVTPTRDVPQGPGTLFAHQEGLKGYKYIVGALNWSSAYVKDPNVLYLAGETYRQRVVVSFSSTLPGGTLDAMLYRAWERTALLEIPRDGRVAAQEHAAAQGASWQAATHWLRDVFCSEQTTEGLYRPGQGICVYAVGTRPKAGGDYRYYWWPQWAGALHYRALLTGDDELRAACDRNDAGFQEYASKLTYSEGIGALVTKLPTCWWMHGGGRGSLLQEAMRPLQYSVLEHSVAENGTPRVMDYGTQATIAEMLLLGAETYGEQAMRTQALVLLDEMAERLDGNFWQFNVGHADSLVHGGQIRSLGHGHAIMANLLAYRQLGDSRYLTDAHRFARYLLAISYATHNGSHDPDFDWRGWCNGSNAGRDQIAEFPPWETQNGLLCISALMDAADLEGGFYDVLWYIARTGLAQFPAARRRKRVFDETMQVRFVARNEIASERDFYDILPYLAYENPHDQTMLASYQGTDCLLGEFVYGGGLVRAADPRLGVLVPRAAMMDLRELREHQVHLWNPTPTPIDTTLTACWTDGSRTTYPVVVPSRQQVRLTLTQ